MLGVLFLPMRPVSVPDSLPHRVVTHMVPAFIALPSFPFRYMRF